VWHELRQLGATIRGSDALTVEAQAVCDEMAQRARQNVEMIIERLSAQGFRFHSNDYEQTAQVPHFPPGVAAPEHAAWLASHFGEVPLSLLSWVRIVGDVWLVGTHPDWPASASADPFVIEVEGSRYPDSPMYVDEIERWRVWGSSGDRSDDQPFVLGLAPDRLHKDNVSGGPAYGMVLPDGCADGLFAGETTMPFVAYLNWVFRSGGFPWPTGSPSQWRVTRTLAKDLLPL
jgi:hypothetical protein